MLRISVTHLDYYLYWRGNESLTLDHLLADITGQVEPTPAMLASRAFHSALEVIQLGDHPVISSDGYTFDLSEMRIIIQLPNSRELKVEKEIDTPSGPVTLVGKVDALTGITVADWKLTERYDLEKYGDSYQWRAYLWMLGAVYFEYHAFLAKYGKDPLLVKILDYQRFRLDTYAKIGEDVTRVVSDLARTIKGRVPET